MKILMVIDMQNDFVSGSLGTKEAQMIVPNVVEKINNFKGRIVFTRDTHNTNYLETEEGQKLPVEHCIKDTKGWEIIQEINANENILDKYVFGSYELPKYLEERFGKIEEITLIGLCTDVCIISNAIILKSYFKEIPIIVDAKCIAGVSEQSHKNAIEAMKMCQIDIINE